MKAASISEIKKELLELPAPQLVELCIGLAKYKKDNKELLSYLLFDASQKQTYIAAIKKEIDQSFKDINKALNLYFIKKSLRKILRFVSKYSRYIEEKEYEVELLLYFVQQLKDSGIPFENSVATHNIYLSQLKKAHKLIKGLHEDLQYDYLKIMQELEA